MQRMHFEYEDPPEARPGKRPLQGLRGCAYKADHAYTKSSKNVRLLERTSSLIYLGRQNNGAEREQAR